MYYDKWEFETALDYFQQALTLQQKVDARYDMIETHLRIGQSYHFLGQDDLALAQHNQAARITAELGLTDSSQAWLAIGKTYGRKGDWDSALQWLEKARQHLTELGKSAMLAECSANIGDIFAGRGEYDLACLHHQDALDIYLRLNMSSAVGRQRCHLGMIRYRMGQYQTAQQHLDQALAQARAIADHIFMPQILQGLAELSFSMEAYANAQAFCEECLHMLRNVGTQQHFFRQAEVSLEANILRAKLAYVQGNSDQAHRLLGTMLAATNLPGEQAALHYELWQLYQNPENRRQALTFYQQLYAQKPYFHYRQCIEELTASRLL